MSISVQTTQRDDVACIICGGEVDVSNAGELRDALDAALAKKPAGIEVDVTDVSYIDSTGIGVLVGAAHHAKDAGLFLKVLHPQKNVARVLNLLGVTDDLGVEE